MEELQQLKEFLDAGFLTQEEYDAKRLAVINKKLGLHGCEESKDEETAAVPHIALDASNASPPASLTSPVRKPVVIYAKSAAIERSAPSTAAALNRRRNAQQQSSDKATVSPRLVVPVKRISRSHSTVGTAADSVKCSPESQPPIPPMKRSLSVTSRPPPRPDKAPPSRPPTKLASLPQISRKLPSPNNDGGSGNSHGSSGGRGRVPLPMPELPMPRAPGSRGRSRGGGAGRGNERETRIDADDAPNRGRGRGLMSPPVARNASARGRPSPQAVRRRLPSTEGHPEPPQKEPSPRGLGERPTPPRKVRPSTPQRVCSPTETRASPTPPRPARINPVPPPPTPMSMPDEPEKPAAPDRSNKPSLPHMTSSSSLLKPQLPPKPPSAMDVTQFVSGEEEQKAWLRRKVINEIVDTEQDYVGNLDIIVEKFLKPIKEYKMMSMEEMAVVFSNIELVKDANEGILFEMQRLREEAPLDAMVGGIFNSERVEYFVQVYTHYCLGQQAAMTAYNTSFKKNSKFRNMVERGLIDEDCRGLDLITFLVMPVQRLCKYPLLLRELVKHTDPSHPDYDNLVNTIDKMSQLVTLVNQSARESENLQKILEIEGSLTRADHLKLIFPGRKFVREGKLTKVSGSHVQERQFFLFNDILIYAKPALVKKQYEFKGLIPINRLVVRDLSNSSSRKNAIELWRIDLKKKYIVYSDEAEVKTEWMRDLESMIAEAADLGQGEDVEANVAFQSRTDEARSKNFLKIAELESRIVGFKNARDVTKKTYIFEGPVCAEWQELGDREPKTIKSAFLFLFEDSLLVTKKVSEKVKKAHHFKFEVDLTNVLVVDLEGLGEGKEKYFELIDLHTKSKYTFRCNDSTAKLEWLKALQSVGASAASSSSSPRTVSSTESGPLSPRRREVTVQRQEERSEAAVVAPKTPQELMRMLPNPMPHSPSSGTREKGCPGCKKPLSLQRKRACRNCQKNFCYNCSSKKRPLPLKGMNKPVRVCDRCFLTAV